MVTVAVFTTVTVAPVGFYKKLASHSFVGASLKK